MTAGRTRDERLLAVAAFVIGAGVMAVELTASRLLAPYFGASMFVWTSLIVTVLLALSAGYWLGGSVAGKGHGLGTVGWLLCGTSILLLAGIALMPTFAVAISGMLVSFSAASAALLIGSFAATVVSFAAPVFLLAAAGPIVLREWSQGTDVGKASGRYFAISTIGSVIGTVAPTLFLVPQFGARRTVELVALVFMGLGLLLLPRRRDSAAALIFIPALLFTELRPTQFVDNVIEQRESPYQLISVVADGEKRYLTFNEALGFQSVYEPGAERTGYYYDYLALIPFLRGSVEEPPKTAIIGLAGGSVARAFMTFLPQKNADLTGVEVDPAVIDVAERHFALGDVAMRVENQDGRMFLQYTNERFDAIVIDAYSVELYIPPHLATEEYFALVASRLTPGGLVAMNINAPSDSSPLLKALVNTVASKFKHVRVVTVPGGWNKLVFASDEPIPLEAVADRLPGGWQDVADAVSGVRDVAFDPGIETFTDDRAPVEFLTDAMVIEAVLRRGEL